MLKLAMMLALTFGPVCAEELFPSIPLQQAQELSRQQKKPILVEFSASWCGPCKAMQRTTFTDPGVIEYTRGHFVPLQLDLDKDSEQAKKLGVGSVPTLIVLEQDREVDRLSGLQKPDELMAWLRNVGRGPAMVETLEQKLASQPESANLHYQLAELYSERARWPEALRECLWIWDQIELVRAQNLLPARSSYLGLLFHRLLKNYPETKNALSKRHSSLQQQLQAGAGDQQVIEDWMNLNRLLEQEAAAADYVVEHPHLFAAQQSLVFELLCREKRWSEAGRWLEAPRAKAESIWAHRQKLEKGCSDLPAETQPGLLRFARSDSHRQWNNLLHALAAAGRAQEADELRDWILQRDHEARLDPQ